MRFEMLIYRHLKTLWDYTISSNKNLFKSLLSQHHSVWLLKTRFYGSFLFYNLIITYNFSKIYSLSRIIFQSTILCTKKPTVFGAHYIKNNCSKNKETAKCCVKIIAQAASLHYNLCLVFHLFLLFLSAKQFKQTDFVQCALIKSC